MISHFGPTVVRSVMKYHFTFSFDSALSKWGELFTDSMTPAVFRHNFWFAGNNRLYLPLCTKLELCSCIRSRYEGGAKSSKWWPCTPGPKLIFWTQNQWASTNCRGLLLRQVSSYSDQGFSFYRTNRHPHRHTHRVTEWQSDRNIRVAVGLLHRRRG